MTVASIGAIVTSHNFEAVLVMLLYQIGTFLQEKAVNHSRKSISALLSYEAKKARLKVNGEALEVEVERVFKKDGKTCIELLIEFYEINKVKKENEK